MVLVESSPEAKPPISCRANSLHGPDICCVGKISTKSVGPRASASPGYGFTFLTTSSSSACRGPIDLAFKPTYSSAVTPAGNPWHLCDNSELAVDQDVGLDIDSINLGSPPIIIAVRKKKKSYTYSSSSTTNSVSEVSVDASSCPTRCRRVSVDSLKYLTIRLASLRFASASLHLPRADLRPPQQLPL